MTGDRASGATRARLLELERRLDRVDRGAGLLRRKRSALAAELFREAKPAIDARARIGAQAAAAYAALPGALAEGAGKPDAEGLPTRRLDVELRASTIWGVPAVSVEGRSPALRTVAARDLDPGLTGPASTDAADAFERLLDLLVDAGPREALIRGLGDQLARTSRQVHVLEQRISPSLRSEARRIAQTLDEREREEQVRLRRMAKRR